MYTWFYVKKKKLKLKKGYLELLNILNIKEGKITNLVNYLEENNKELLKSSNKQTFYITDEPTGNLDSKTQNTT